MPMMTTDRQEKKTLILAYETAMSRQLALHVIEKSQPRVWMIFIPIIFVLYFWKLKDYENGLKNFAENYLIPRRSTLDTVFAAMESGSPVNIELLVEQFGDLPATTLALGKEWVTVLADHFRLLLSAEGDSYQQLVRSGYQNKSNYLAFCRQIDRTETAFNAALLKTIDGDDTALGQVAEAMAAGMKNLRSQSAEIF